MDTYIGFDKLCYNRKKDNDPILPVARTTIERMVASGEFPKPLRIGNRSLWSRSTVDGFLRRRLMLSSSTDGALKSRRLPQSDDAQTNPIEAA